MRKAKCFCFFMEIQELLALNLRRIRVAKNISQDELALLAGVERAYVGHIERGKKNPTIQTLAKLAHALNCEVKDLFRTDLIETTRVPNLPAGRRK
ncbi:helix-turn-helix domain-containing protein [Ochrobactrum sp. S1502_03]|uniref:helix-turn-helix domain-containing protein n=1 Tax=Ochrobactrum sp. S1502_03 TaxID=3108451 RepID=UPI0037CBD684